MSGQHGRVLAGDDWRPTPLDPTSTRDPGPPRNAGRDTTRPRWRGRAGSPRAPRGRRFPGAISGGAGALPRFAVAGVAKGRRAPATADEPPNDRRRAVRRTEKGRAAGTDPGEQARRRGGTAMRPRRTPRRRRRRRATGRRRRRSDFHARARGKRTSAVVSLRPKNRGKSGVQVALAENRDSEAPAPARRDS